MKYHATIKKELEDQSIICPMNTNYRARVICTIILKGMHDMNSQRLRQCA